MQNNIQRIRQENFLKVLRAILWRPFAAGELIKVKILLSSWVGT